MNIQAPVIESLSFDSDKAGLHLLVFGAIHGNEVCGPLSIRKVIRQLEEGKLALKLGRVTFVPIANSTAYAVNQRYVVANLNRIFKPHEQPRHEEEALANQLCKLVDECDYLLDLHSFHTTGVPFVFRDYEDDKVVPFAACLGVPHILTGWPELYGTATGKELNQGDTVEYASKMGKSAVLVECGMHTEPEAVQLAEACILNAMRFLGMLEGEPEQTETTEVRFTEIYTMPENGGKLSRDWQNLDAASAGTVVATKGDGTPIKMAYDGFMIMPNHEARAGDEWFYLGKNPF